jgi:hypothetical protein
LFSFPQKEKFTFGANGGFNRSFFNDNAVDAKPYNGYSYGLKIRLNLRSGGSDDPHSINWYFESGINYIHQGYTLIYFDHSFAYSLQQLEVPLFMTGRIAEKKLPRKMAKKNFALYTKFGAVPSFQKSTYLSEIFTNETMTLTSEVTQNPFNIYLAGGVGMEKEFNTLIIGAGLSIHSGLINTTQGTLLNFPENRKIDYGYHGNYFSFDLFIMIKQRWKNPKKQMGFLPG